VRPDEQTNEAFSATESAWVDFLTLGARRDHAQQEFHPDHYPMVRWVLPWLFGLVAGLLLPALSLWFVLLLGGAFLASLFYFYRFRDGRFGAVLLLLLCWMGVGYSQYQAHRLHPAWSPRMHCYTATVLEPPVEKSRSLQLSVEMEGHRRVVLYLANDSLAQTLRMGDRLCLEAQVALPHDSLAEGEFDYASYLLSHNYSGTAYVASGYWNKLSTHAPLSLKQRALALRERLLSVYRRLGFEGESLAVLSALTLGDKNGLPTETRDLFSVTGVGHVLALSGLHVGILYACVLFLCSRLYLGRFTPWLRCLLPIVLLWVFAYVTGLSVSVVRAVVMCSLLALQRQFHRETPPINALLFAAFVTTLYNPYVLYDLGFRLSYTAAAAILLFYPFVERLGHPQNRLLNYFWGIFSLSLITQVAVAPWLFQAFGSYSSYFLLGNFWALPFTFVLVVGALLMLGCGWFPLLQTGVAAVLKGALSLFLSGLQALSALPHASMKIVAPSTLTLCCFYLMLFLLLAYLHQRKPKQLCLSLTFGLLTCLSQSYTLLRPSPAYLLFRPTTRGVSILGAERGEKPVYLSSSDSLGLITFQGKRLLSVRNFRWSRFETAHPLPIDYLLLSARYRGSVADLQHLFQIRQVILSTAESSSEENVQRLYEECRQLRLPVLKLHSAQSFMLK
jgi:competence protein ComEC